MGEILQFPTDNRCGFLNIVRLPEGVEQLPTSGAHVTIESALFEWEQAQMDITGQGHLKGSTHRIFADRETMGFFNQSLDRRREANRIYRRLSMARNTGQSWPTPGGGLL